jgi:hypothetical protein
MVGTVGDNARGLPGRTEGVSVNHRGQNVRRKKNWLPKSYVIRIRERRIPGETGSPAVNERMEFRSCGLQCGARYPLCPYLDRVRAQRILRGMKR